MSPQAKKRVAVVEPSPVVREGLRLLLEQTGRFAVTTLVDDPQQLDPQADIVLFNPQVVSGFRRFSVRNLLPDTPPDTPVVAIVYGYVDAETLAGFDGAIDIYDDGEQIIKKLESRLAATFHGHHDRSAGEGAELSGREKEILISVANGLTNKEIADRHFISVHTVISHRKNITRKTGIKTISGLTLYAMFNNLISPDEQP